MPKTDAKFSRGNQPEVATLWSQGFLLPESVELMGYSVEEYIERFAPPGVRAFIMCFAGNATQAAQDAGYGWTADGEVSDRVIISQQGWRLMNMPLVREAIRRRGWEDPDQRFIATRLEREMLLTATLRDESLDIKQRLRALELLGKSHGDYIERKEIQINETFEERLNRLLSKEEKSE